MTLTLELSPELEARLEEEAEKHGLSLQEYALQKLTDSVTAQEEGEVAVPVRPVPTPEQAKLGIMPAVIGNGSGTDIMRRVRSQSRLNEAEYQAFERAIAENRAMRRQLARERDE